ncbi:DUF3027 domain-containing protein [Nocardia sp. R16R-3T]
MSAVSVSQSGVRPILADAVDVARRALLELEPTGVGAHLGVTAEDESAATHRFAATLPGYRGWQWAVVVAAPPGAHYATVSESALLPGPDALVAPDFIPWEQRIRPGDLAPGDLLAPPANDPRLVPGYVASGDPAVDEVALEIGLGRPQVLSREGREEAAERWYSEFGPETDMAKAAPATCGSCGFYLPLAGALRSAFGVCGNAMGADGRVVHTEYGCGAHSDVEVPTGGGSPLYEAYDDAAFDVIPAEAPGKPAPAAAADAVSEHEPTASETSEAATGAESDEHAESDAVAQPSGTASGDVPTGATGPVESDVVQLPGDAAAESSTSGRPDVVAHDVADISSAAAPSDPAADVVAEPSAGVERVPGASDVDNGSVGDVVPGTDAAESPAGSTTDASASGEVESNGAAAEISADVAGSEAATEDSANVSTSGESSAETVASQSESSDDVATEAAVVSGAAVREASPTIGVDGGVAGGQSSVGESVSDVWPGALASGVDRVAELGTDTASEPGIGVAGAQPESDANAGAPADFAGDAESAGGASSAVRAEAADTHRVSADTHGDAVGQIRDADGEAVSADSASADIDGRAARAESWIAGAGAETADADNASADTDAGTVAVRGEAVDTDSAAAGDDGGQVDADGEITGAKGEAADSAGGNRPGPAARPEFGSSL